MKNAMQKDFWREIGHTRSRFFSIMILVALSVAFLSGLKATAPDMKHTGDDYLDSLHLADIQVLSTLGLTDEDIAALRAQDKIEDAEGEYVIDAFASSDSLDAVVKVLSLTDRGISDVLLREGRMPERADECVVEENMLSLMSISIGDTITLTPGDDLSDALAQDTYTVVGTVRSPVYLAVERGTSTLGSGTVKAYLYLPREAFTLDYYTAAYVRVSGAEEMTAFYDDYDDYIDDVIDSLEDFGDARAILRHDELVDEATEKLDDAQKELDDAKAEADKELGDARKELDDARKELDDGWKEYDDGKQELADSRTKLDDAKAELEDGEQEYADGVKKYDQAVRDYEKGQKDYADGVKDYEKGAQQLADGADELEAGKEKLDEGQKQLDALGNTVAGALQNDPNYAGVTGGTIIDELGRGDENTAAATDAALDKMRAQLEGGIAQAQQGLAKIDAGIEQCDEVLAQIDAALAALGEDQSEQTAAQRAKLEQQRADTVAQRSALVQQRGKVSAQLSELQSQLAALSTVSSGSIAANKQQLDQGRADYESGKQQLSAGYRDLRDGKKELDKAKKELDEAPQKLADAKQELADARKELDDGWKEYYDGEEKYADGEKELADAYRELTDGEKDYREGLREYEDGKAEADEKIADAEEKIADARRKVADIESCEWYLFSRSYNPGYTGFGQDAERMANLASVFPIIFFLVAALVSLTTMSRMVETDRVEILTGVRNRETLGSPLTLCIYNRDYENWRAYMSDGACDVSARTVTKVRPGHADLAGVIKFAQNDARNILERASARETAIRVAAGSVFKQYLSALGVEIGGYVKEVCGVKDEGRYAFSELSRAKESGLGMLDAAAEKEAEEKVASLKTAGVVSFAPLSFPLSNKASSPAKTMQGKTSASSTADKTLFFIINISCLFYRPEGHFDFP
mgnify:CR=1 FL=1